MKTATAAKPITLPTANRLDHACKKFWRSRYLLLMLLPALIWYIVFMYAPMYGAQIAFRDFCLLYTSPSPRDRTRSRMPSSA